MKLQEARELFSAYKEGELPSDEEAALERLLAEDDEARTEYDSFCRVLDSLATLRQEEAPPDFTEKVKNRIRRRSGGRIFGMARLAGISRVPYELFSLVLILIILTVYLLTLPVRHLSPGDEDDEQQAPEVER